MRPRALRARGARLVSLLRAVPLAAFVDPSPSLRWSSTSHLLLVPRPPSPSTAAAAAVRPIRLPCLQPPPSLHATAPSRNSAAVPPAQAAVPPHPPYRHASMPPCRRAAVLPYCRIAVLPYCRIAVLPYWRIAVLAYCRIAVLPQSRANLPPHYLTLVMPCCHTTMSLLLPQPCPRAAHKCRHAAMSTCYRATALPRRRAVYPPSRSAAAPP